MKLYRSKISSRSSVYADFHQIFIIIQPRPQGFLNIWTALSKHQTRIWRPKTVAKKIKIPP